MKKIALLLSLALLSSAMFSQNLIGLRGGVTKNFSTGSPTYFGPGATFQHGLNQNMAVGANIDYHVGENSQSWMNVEPRFDYYLNSVFNGFHIGSNVAYTIYSESIGGVSVSSSQMHIGASLGYTMPVSEKLVFDIGTGVGYTMFTGSGSLGIRPAVTLGLKL